MRKFICTDDHSALIEAAGGRVFTFFDRSDRLTKAASDVITRSDIQNFMPPDDHFGVHLVTMGAEEAFGPNRNGDSASIRSLTDYHPTFEKFGCVFREHNNRDPRTQGVGQVKLARYNPKMYRGELIVWVSKDKAPDMYKKASNGEELSWSMSMRLPHDECSCCRKKSKTTADYCDHLKRSMLKYVPGFEKYAYARNEDDVKFFDISEVKRRADRIATYLGYFGDAQLMAKAASEIDQAVISGAEWADYYLGSDSPVPFTPWEEGTLEKLAAAEDFVKHADSAVLYALAKMVPANLGKEQVEILADPDFRAVAGELAKRAMFLNFPTFASIVTGKPIEVLEKEASFCDVVGVKLPSLMSDLFRGGGAKCGEDAAAAVAPDECGCSFSPQKDSIDRLMRDVGDSLGMSQDSVNNRVLSVTVIKSARVKKPLETKTFDPYYSAMAEAYGYYLVKAAHVAKNVSGVSENTLFRGLVASLMIDQR
jgi:hypothetical protein